MKTTITLLYTIMLKVPVEIQLVNIILWMSKQNKKLLFKIILKFNNNEVAIKRGDPRGDKKDERKV